MTRESTNFTVDLTTKETLITAINMEREENIIILTLMSLQLCTKYVNSKFNDKKLVKEFDCNCEKDPKNCRHFETKDK